MNLDNITTLKTIQHRLITMKDAHSPYRWAVATEDDLFAIQDAGEDDILQVAFVMQTGAIWTCTQVSPSPLFVQNQGKRGERGEKGDKGDKGDPGDKGEKGDKGDIGRQGVPGLPGERGEKGDKGDKGDQGTKGDPGDQGPPGVDGLKGDKGDKGDQGEPGVAGEAIKGDKGDPGEKGEKGDKGDKGDPGEQGESGNFFKWKVASRTELHAITDFVEEDVDRMALVYDDGLGYPAHYRLKAIKGDGFGDWNNDDNPAPAYLFRSVTKSGTWTLDYNESQAFNVDGTVNNTITIDRSKITGISCAINMVVHGSGGTLTIDGVDKWAGDKIPGDTEALGDAHTMIVFGINDGFIVGQFTEKA